MGKDHPNESSAEVGHWSVTICFLKVTICFLKGHISYRESFQRICYKDKGLQRSPGGVGFFLVDKGGFPSTARILNKSLFLFFFTLRILPFTLYPLTCYLASSVRGKRTVGLTLQKGKSWQTQDDRAGAPSRAHPALDGGVSVKWSGATEILAHFPIWVHLAGEPFPADWEVRKSSANHSDLQDTAGTLPGSAHQASLYQRV